VALVPDEAQLAAVVFLARSAVWTLDASIRIFRILK
jgi:hypothetical protein